MSAKDATISAKDATMSAKDATMCAKVATMRAKDATTCAEARTRCANPPTRRTKGAPSRRLGGRKVRIFKTAACVRGGTRTYADLRGPTELPQNLHAPRGSPLPTRSLVS